MEELELIAAEEAIREYPKLKKANAALREKVAYFERKQRVDDLLASAHLKQASIDEDVDLMTCKDDELVVWEKAISSQRPNGVIKLGSPEEPAEKPEKVASKGEDGKPKSGLHKLLLDPEGYASEKA